MTTTNERINEVIECANWFMKDQETILVVLENCNSCSYWMDLDLITFNPGGLIQSHERFVKETGISIDIMVFTVLVLSHELGHSIDPYSRKYKNSEIPKEILKKEISAWKHARHFLPEYISSNTLKAIAKYYVGLYRDGLLPSLNIENVIDKVVA